MPKLLGWPAKLTSRVSEKKLQAVADARTKLTEGQAFRQSKRETQWEQSEDQYSGHHWAEQAQGDPTADLITINMSFSTVNTIVPYITGSEPHFLVLPYSGDATMRNAKIQEALLNRLWRSEAIDGQEHLETAAVDFLVYGDGYIKVGYDLEELRDEDGDYYEIAQLWVARIDPWDLWIDPNADGLHNARWVCQRLRISRAELEEDGRYVNLDEENVTYGGPHYKMGRTDEDEGKKLHMEIFDGSESAVVFEFYDLIAHTMVVFSDGPKPLRWVDDVLDAPIVQLPNYRIPRSPYHMGELEQLWPMQQELNKTRSHMITHRRRNVQKFLAKKDVLADGAVDALKSPIVNDVALLSGDGPIDQLIKAVEIPNLSADIYNVSEVMMRDIYEISGVNEYLRGATPAIRRTATEATIIEGASNVKSQYKLRQIEKASRKIGRFMLRLAADVFPETEHDELQLYLTGREAEIVNRADQGQQIADLMRAEGGVDPEAISMLATPDMKMDAVVSPDPSIFVGEYEVDVEQSSTELRNPVLKEQKYREMATDLTSMFPILAQAGVTINLKKVFELWFEAAGVDDVDAMFEAGMTPQTMMAQQQQPQPGKGPRVAPGEPNIAAVQPPADMISADNTGANPPAEGPSM